MADFAAATAAVPGAESRDALLHGEHAGVLADSVVEARVRLLDLSRSLDQARIRDVILHILAQN